MSTGFTRIGITGKRDDARVDGIIRDLLSWLDDPALDVRIDPAFGERFTPPGQASPDAGDTWLASRDLLIVIGGDGTFLACARAVVGRETALLGINLGRLGFLVDVPPGAARDTIRAVLGGDAIIERRALVEARIQRQDDERFRGVALNDAVLHVSGVVRVLEFDLLVDGLAVGRIRADGLVIATPTGSTAYALSAGGPIVTPDLDALVVVPVCPHGLNHRPLILAGNARVECRLSPESRSTAQLALDGRDNVDFGPEDRLLIRRADEHVRLVHPPGHHFLHTLRTKLRWAHQP